MSFGDRDDPRHRLGALAEDLVCEHLSARGYAIVERNARVGRLEIDVVASRGALLVFCEVRARRTADFAHPLSTISEAKIRNVRRAAAAWIGRHGRGGRAVRFDAAAVTLSSGAPVVEYVEDAF